MGPLIRLLLGVLPRPARRWLPAHREVTKFLVVGGTCFLVPLWAARYLFDLRVPEVSRLVQETSDFASGMIAGTLLAMGFRLWAYRTWVFPPQRVRLGHGGAQPPHPDERAA